MRAPLPPKVQIPLKNRIRGLLLGHALGDAYGDAITNAKPYSDPLEISDDTSQMLCIADSILEHGQVNTEDIAKRLYNWANEEGQGIGILTKAVLCADDYLAAPHRKAKEYWLSTGGISAPNGALMRTSVLGIIGLIKPTMLNTYAQEICQLTHADERCVASCVVMVNTVHELLSNKSRHTALRHSLELGPSYSDEIIPYVLPRLQKTISELELNNSSGQGYTLKTLSAALWALKHAKSFNKGITIIANSGGDADTNTCVSGALLGTRFGDEAIQESLLQRLPIRDELIERADALYKLFG
ncbi:MAG: ADP-ribosylglycohydrolase family protein [Desulfovibrio sp.]